MKKTRFFLLGLLAMLFACTSAYAIPGNPVSPDWSNYAETYTIEISYSVGGRLLFQKDASFSWSPDPYPSPVEIYVTTNGKTSVPEKLIGEDTYYQLLLPEHGGSIEFEFTSHLSLTEAQYAINNFTWTEGIIVDLDAIGYGSIDWAPKKEAYAFGDTITITTSPQEGQVFCGWFNFDDYSIPLGEPIQISNHLVKQAVFLPEFMENCQLAGDTPWLPIYSDELGGFVLSSENLQYRESAILKINHSTPVTATTEYQQMGALKLSALEYRIGNNETAIPDSSSWEKTSITTASRGTIQIVATSYSKDDEENTVYLRNLDTASGYPLNIYSSHGQVQRSPNQTNFLAEKSVALQAVPDEGYQFLYWLSSDLIDIEYRTNPDLPLTIPSVENLFPYLGGKVNLYAIFGQQVSWNGPEIWHWGEAGWSVLDDSNSTNGQTLELRSTSDRTYSHGLFIPLEGPGILSFQFIHPSDLSSSSKIRYGLDDETLASSRYPTEWETVKLYIEDGPHYFYIANQQSSYSGEIGMQVRSIEFAPGLELTTNVIGSGSVTQSNSDSLIPSGQSCSLHATPSADNEFLAWLDESGILYFENPLSRTPETNENLSALFGRRVSNGNKTLNLGGLNTWTVSGSTYNQTVAKKEEALAFIGLPTPGGIELDITKAFEISGDATAEVYINGVLDQTIELHTGETSHVQAAVADAPYQILLRLINDDHYDDATFTLSNIIHHDGLPFTLNETFGGEITCSHSNGWYPQGTTIQLSANPITGNVLTEWREMIDASGTEYSFELLEPTIISPRFDLDYLPDVEEATASTPNDQYYFSKPYQWMISEIHEDGSYDIHSQCRALYHILALSFTGPGLLKGDGITSSPADAYLSASTSGDSDSADKDDSSWTIRIKEGPQWVSLRLLPSDEYQYFSEATLQNVRFEPGYTINLNNTNTSGINSVDSDSPLDVTFSEGDTVTLTAVPKEFYVFSGWGPEIDSTDNPITLTIDQSYQLEPSATLPASNGLLHFNRSDQSQFINYLADAGPNGGECLQFVTSEEYQYIRLAIPLKDQDGYLGFKSKIAEGAENTSSISISGNGISKTISEVSDNWVETVLFVPGNPDPSDEKIIEFTILLYPDSELLISDIQYETGLGISVTSEGGTAHCTPRQLTYSTGTEVSLSTTTENTENTFMAWAGSFLDFRSNFSHQLTESINLTAYYGKSFEINGLTFLASQDSSWSVSPYNSASGCSDMLTTTLTGPGLFSWEVDIAEGSNMAMFQDNEVLHHPQMSTMDQHYTFAIPEGQHTVGLYQTGKSSSVQYYYIRNPQFTEGYALDISSPVGELTKSPDKTTYELGDIVEINLDLPDNCQFEGWTGSFSGNPKNFTIEIEDSYQATALVRKEIRVDDLLWNVSANDVWQISPNDIYSPVLSSKLDKPSTATATSTVSGPSTLFIRAGDTSSWRSNIEIKLDEQVIDLTMDHNSYYAWIDIPSGDHQVSMSHIQTEEFSSTCEQGLYQSILLSYRMDTSYDTWLADLEGLTTSQKATLERMGDRDNDLVMDFLEYIFDRSPAIKEPHPLAELIQGSLGQSPWARIHYAPTNLSDRYSLQLQQSTNMTDWTTLYDFADMDTDAFSGHLDVDLPDYDADNPCFLRIHLEEQ